MINNILWLIAGAVLGAVLSVVAMIFLYQPLMSFILGGRRKWAKFRKYVDPLAGKPNQLKFRNIITEWVSLHGTGEIPLLHKHLRTEFIKEYVSLPKDLEALRNHCREELEQKKKDVQSDVWNGKRFALVKYGPTRYGTKEKAGLCFAFKLTDYASFIAITSKADEVGQVKDEAGVPTTIRNKYFPYFDLDTPNPYLTHSFGINLVVITKDRKIIFTQRNALVAKKSKYYSIPMNEGMQYPMDLNKDGQPSFLDASKRGLQEELGVEPEILGTDAKAIEFLNFGALAKANEYALLGRVKLPIGSLDLENRYQTHAKDKSLETCHKLYAIDYNPDAILEFVNTHKPWTHNGLATIYFAMVREWGYRETQSALSKRPLDWNII